MYITSSLFDSPEQKSINHEKVVINNDFDQRHIPDAEGRVVSVDNGIFIHAIVPRHVETVVLLTHT